MLTARTYLALQDWPAAERTFLLDPRFAVIGGSGDGQTALSETAALSPELLIVDSVLSGMDGQTLLRHLQQRIQPPRTVYLMRFFREKAPLADEALPWPGTAEALLTAAPDIVIDIGEPKDSIGADLTVLTEQTGIPFIHIDATVQTSPEAYRTLGKLLGREEKAEELALWCERTYASITAMMERVDADNARKELLYCLGDKGTNVIAEGSFHAETINMMSRNLAVIADVFPGGLGNEVDLEQILLWDPEIIIFAPDSCYETIAGDAQWQNVSAVAAGNYFKTPEGPYGWLSRSSAILRYAMAGRSAVPRLHPV